MQRASTVSDVSAKQFGKLLRHHAVDNAGHEHDAQLIGQIIYRPFQDVSDHTVGYLALREQLLAATLQAALPEPNPSNGAFSGFFPSGPLGCGTAPGAASLRVSTDVMMTAEDSGVRCTGP